jgi:hypothetical protein
MIGFEIKLRDKKGSSLIKKIYLIRIRFNENLFLQIRFDAYKKENTSRVEGEPSFSMNQPSRIQKFDTYELFLHFE